MRGADNLLLQLSLSFDKPQSPPHSDNTQSNLGCRNATRNLKLTTKRRCENREKPRYGRGWILKGTQAFIMGAPHRTRARCLPGEGVPQTVAMVETCKAYAGWPRQAAWTRFIYVHTYGSGIRGSKPDGFLVAKLHNEHQSCQGLKRRTLSVQLQAELWWKSCNYI